MATAASEKAKAIDAALETPVVSGVNPDPTDALEEEVPQGTNFAELLGDDDEVLGEEPTAPPVTPKAEEEKPLGEPPAPEVPAVEAPKTPAPVTEPAAPAEVPKVEAEAPKAPAEPPATPVVGAQPPAEKTPTEEEILAQRAKWRKEAQVHLEKHFQGLLGAEDVDTLRLEPEKVLPKLLAQAYLETYDSLLNSMHTQLPAVVVDAQKRLQASQQYEQQFYGRWPALSDPRYQPVVLRTVQAYRQANPQAPADQVIQEAGAMAMVALRLPLEVPKAPPAPEAPKAPPAGFTPAPAGAGKPTPKPNDNIFAQIAEDDLIEERLP